MHAQVTPLRAAAHAPAHTPAPAPAPAAASLPKPTPLPYPAPRRTYVLGSPALTALFTVIRDKDTPPKEFAAHADRLMTCVQRGAAAGRGKGGLLMGGNRVWACGVYMNFD
jgi:hypothetical protein